MPGARWVSALVIRGDPMTPIAAIALVAALASPTTRDGAVTFHGAVVKGAAGGITGVDVPANQRRTTTTLGVSITIVGGCDTHSTRGRTAAQCDPRTVPPRVAVRPGGDGVMVTTVYF